MCVSIWGPGLNRSFFFFFKQSTNGITIPTNQLGQVHHCCRLMGQIKTDKMVISFFFFYNSPGATSHTQTLQHVSSLMHQLFSYPHTHSADYKWKNWKKKKKLEVEKGSGVRFNSYGQRTRENQRERTNTGSCDSERTICSQNCAGDEWICILALWYLVFTEMSLRDASAPESIKVIITEET